MNPPKTGAVGAARLQGVTPGIRRELEEDMGHYTAPQRRPAWLIDAHRAGQYGGTGKIAEWNVARSLARKAPILLAGGLNPTNVAQAVRQVQPWGVDVASGVETSPGVKDPQKVRAFVDAVRKNEEEMPHDQPGCSPG